MDMTERIMNVHLMIGLVLAFPSGVAFLDPLKTPMMRMHVQGG